MPPEERTISTRMKGFFLISICALVSFLLATSTDMSHQELGALINYIYPPAIGVASLLFFLLITFVISNKIVQRLILGILCAYNLYIGFALYLQKEYWPLVIP